MKLHTILISLLAIALPYSVLAESIANTSTGTPQVVFKADQGNEPHQFTHISVDLDAASTLTAWEGVRSVDVSAAQSAGVTSFAVSNAGSVLSAGDVVLIRYRDQSDTYQYNTVSSASATNVVLGTATTTALTTSSDIWECAKRAVWGTDSNGWEVSASPLLVGISSRPWVFRAGATNGTVSVTSLRPQRR